jgi:hypothetical protein
MMNAYLTVLLAVIVTDLIAVVLLLFSRKVFNLEKLRSSHDVGGFLIAIVGTLYAVLLGLIVVDAMQQYQHAREVTERETSNLANVFILAKGLSNPRSSQLRQMCVGYAQQVIDTEMDRLQEGTYCPLSQRKAIDLMSSLMDFEPKTEREKAVYSQLISEASQFWENREERVSIAEKGIPFVEWVVLIAGAIITIVFTYCFALEHTPLQAVMTAMVATLLSLNLALLLIFGYPFRGDLAVQTQPFSSIRELLVPDTSKP